jgi:c-di-GMP-binding flagellar brake protein YcgR
MQIDSIIPGGLMELMVCINDRTMSFRSEISQVINNSILVAPIKVNDQTVGFSDNCQISFLYASEGKLYLWDNATITLVRYGGDIYHKIDIFGEGKPYNRRSSYRLYLGEDMPIYVNTAAGPSALIVLIKDISETGFGFITAEEIDIDRTVRLKLKENGIILNLSAVVVRKEKLEHHGTFLYGCRFIEKYDRLGKFIAAKQSSMLRKKNGSVTLNRMKAQMQTKNAQNTLRK